MWLWAYSHINTHTNLKIGIHSDVVGDYAERPNFLLMRTLRTTGGDTEKTVDAVHFGCAVLREVSGLGKIVK